SLEQAFVKERVPFQMVRGLAFFERKENRDVLAYLRLLVNPRDNLSFLRVVNEPARGIGKTSLDHLQAYAEPRELPLLAAARDVDGWDNQQDCVAVMTLHAAKGLEFPVVYMVAMEQGILPHERSLSKDEDLEEERRLAFVGMTRAKEELYLCCTRLREFRGQTLYAVPSMFLDELPQERIEHLDLSAAAAGTRQAMDAWRTGSPAADQGWIDAG